ARAVSDRQGTARALQAGIRKSDGPNLALIALRVERKLAARRQHQPDLAMIVLDRDLPGRRLGGNHRYRAVARLDVRSLIKVFDGYFAVRCIYIDFASGVLNHDGASFGTHVYRARDRSKLDSAIGRGDGDITVDGLCLNIRIRGVDCQIYGPGYSHPGVLGFQ